MAKRAGEWILDHHKVQGDVNILTVCNTGSLATSVCLYFTQVISAQFNYILFAGLWNRNWCDHLSSRDWETRDSVLYPNSAIPPGLAVSSCTRFLLMTFTCEKNKIQADRTRAPNSKRTLCDDL